MEYIEEVSIRAMQGIISRVDLDKIKMIASGHGDELIAKISWQIADAMNDERVKRK
jgi:hypothetical protein